LREKCLNLEIFLKHNLLDLDRLNLFLELNILKEIIRLKNDKPINILNYIKRIFFFSNAYISYRIMLIILVSITLAERKFLKLNIIKIYLRSTMSQQRLNKFIILSIKKMLNKINYDNLIYFCITKYLKINFK